MFRSGAALVMILCDGFYSRLQPIAFEMGWPLTRRALLLRSLSHFVEFSGKCNFEIASIVCFCWCYFQKSETPSSKGWQCCSKGIWKDITEKECQHLQVSTKGKRLLGSASK